MNSQVHSFQKNTAQHYSCADVRPKRLLESDFHQRKMNVGSCKCCCSKRKKIELNTYFRLIPIVHLLFCLTYYASNMD